MKSSAGEQVQLSSEVVITDEVENWLGDLAIEMKSCLSKLLGESLK